MADGTRYYLGDVELDPCEVEFTWAYGPSSMQVTLRQPIDLADAIEALPNPVALRVVCANQENTADPSLGTWEFPNLIVKEVIRRNDAVCEIHLRDMRDSYTNRICPADFRMRWKDGVLDGTDLPTLQLAVEYLAHQCPELDEALDLEAFGEVAGRDELPFDLPTSGGRLGEQIEALANLVGATTVVRPATGKVAFALVGSITANPINVDAYNWQGGFLPSWLTTNRKLRGLPKVVRCYYKEKHAIRLVGGTNTETTTLDPSLRMGLTQVYAHGDKFLTLEELLVAFGLSETAITDAQIAAVFNTVNFDGTGIEALGSYDSERKSLIAIIKADWRSLWRIEYPETAGRVGGWKIVGFGYFKQTEDKDGNLYYSGDITGRGVRCEWTEWLQRAEEASGFDQATIINATVARSHLRSGGMNPDAPFVASWVSEKDNVIRVSPGNMPATAQHVWPGRMTPEKELRITNVGITVDDQGQSIGTTGGLHFPNIDDVVFDSQFSIEVFVVAERRLPNTTAKWTAVDVAAFSDGERDLLELEVGDELYVLRDYVNPSEGKPAQGDGLGTQLEFNEPQQDAERRVAAVIDRLTTPLTGSGTAIGPEAAYDLYPGQGIAAVTLTLDGVAVTSTIDAGAYDSEEARQRRKARREAHRVVDVNGKVAAV